MDKRCKTIPAAWQSLLSSWVNSLKASGASNQTVRLRRAHIARFARAVIKPPLEIEANDVNSYLACRDWSRETRRAFVASFKNFCRFIERPELIESLPKVPAALPAPRPAPTDAYELALESASRRVRLMLRLAAELGLRRNEIAQINTSDLGEDLLGFSLMVHGKGGKIRFMPISADSMGELNRQANASGWVFPGNIDGHISANWAGKLLASALPGRWTAHTLRHRFATRAYSASDDLLAVSRLLGHASVATTQRYVATDAARLRKVASLAA